mgnify:CR=1 FL=1
MPTGASSIPRNGSTGLRPKGEVQAEEEGALEVDVEDPATGEVIAQVPDAEIASVCERVATHVPPLSHAARSVSMIQFPHRSHRGPRGRLLRASVALTEAMARSAWDGVQVRLAD